MGNRATPSRSFNTVKHSNRANRLKRQRQERIVLLSICLVVIALLISLLVFLICSIVDTVNDKNPNGNTPNGGDPLTNNQGSSQELTYMSVTQVNTAIRTGELLVVNGSYAYEFPTTALGLKNIYDNRVKFDNVSNTYMVGDASWKLQGTTLDAFNAMMLKYYEVYQDGTTLITSAYRTYEAQDALNSSVAAGYSDHHTGLCVSLKKQTATGRENLESDHWIYQNCHKYGFIVRYPEDKSDITGVSDYAYCLRYVGVAHATYIYQNDLCLEEYVELLKTTYTASNHLSITGADGKRYEVYHVTSTGEITTIQVPKNYKYSISGDNMSGFIVTVHLDEPISA